MGSDFGVFVRDVDLLYPVEPLLKQDEAGRRYEELVAVIASKAVKDRRYKSSNFSEGSVAIIARSDEDRMTNLVGIRTDHVSVNKSGDIVLRGPRIEGLPSKYL